MAITLVGIGSAGNDGTGTPARSAFDRINGNFTDAENAASKLVATTAQAKAGTAGVLPDAAGVHAAFKQYGLGGIVDLRSTVYSTGIPSDLYGKGAVFGFADGYQLGIPGFVTNDYGTLEVGNQWTDASGLASAYRRFTTGASGYPLEFLQTSLSDTTWGAWCETYGQRNILGTVSQSGGIPTGAIIESGSNANGHYVKYADGTMICTHAATINTVCTESAGAAIGFFAQVFWTLPIVFSTITHANAGGRREGYTTFTTTGTVSTTHVQFFHNSNLSFTDNVNYSFYAIGRWY